MEDDFKGFVQRYLDAAIRAWRAKRDDGDEVAVYYIDAFQSARVSLLGNLLDQGDTDDMG